MKIAFRNTPSSVSALARRVIRPRVAPARVPGVVPGRVVKPPIVETPNLPPVHFFAEADVDSGSEATLRSEALTNRSNRPVEIHEIRFTAFSDIVSVFDAVDPGGILHVQIIAGGKPVTAGFVPIWLLGRTENEAEQHPIVSIASTSACAIYVWRLVRPWHLPPNVPIEVQFQHKGGLHQRIRAQIGFAGKYVASSASTSHIPYAAAYLSKPFALADNAFDESSESDLLNTTGRVITIDRIIARVGVARAFAGSRIDIYGDKDNISAARSTSIRILTSKNLPIIKDYSSVRSIFGAARSIDVAFPLEAHEFLRVGVRNVSADQPSTPFTTYTAQAFVSIVGSREEAI